MVRLFSGWDNTNNLYRRALAAVEKREEEPGDSEIQLHILCFQ